MAVTLLHGAGNLICDGVDVGGVEFSIASPEDGPDVTRRGKVWGNKKAVAACFSWTFRPELRRWSAVHGFTTRTRLTTARS